MKTDSDVDAIMNTIPVMFQGRWCGAETGPCACMGCVQICNRKIMAEKVLSKPYGGDPEYVDESKIPPEIYDAYKITKSEWESWKVRTKYVEPVRESGVSFETYTVSTKEPNKNAFLQIPPGTSIHIKWPKL